jgi:hypothetical protein
VRKPTRVDPIVPTAWPIRGPEAISGPDHQQQTFTSCKQLGGEAQSFGKDLDTTPHMFGVGTGCKKQPGKAKENVARLVEILCIAFRH